MPRRSLEWSTAADVHAADVAMTGWTRRRCPVEPHLLCRGRSWPVEMTPEAPWTHRTLRVLRGRTGKTDRFSFVTLPLPLRRDLPPDDTTVVLRAGVMSADNVARAAERTFALYAVYGISVEGVIDMTMQEACRGDRIASYRRVRLSTFGRVREAGFALLATFDHPHFTLVLADLSELTLARLDHCFDEPIPNPGRPPEG